MCTCDPCEKKLVEDMFFYNDLDAELEAYYGVVDLDNLTHDDPLIEDPLALIKFCLRYAAELIRDWLLLSEKDAQRALVYLAQAAVTVVVGSEKLPRAATQETD